MTEPGLLVVFSGPSGVGKGTVLREFFKISRNCVYSVSATTRPPRPGEREGEDYYFVSRESFGRMIDNGELLEHAEYSGNLYGTPRQTVERQLKAGKNVILEIEPAGAKQIKRILPDTVFVFVMPPSVEELRDRLNKRGTETPKTLEARLRAALREMRTAGEYDYIIVNDTPLDSAKKLDAILVAGGCAVKRKKEFVAEVLGDA